MAYTILGTVDSELIEGSQADDFIWGDQGNDTLAGGLGSDTLLGIVGDDILNGNFGDDNLNGNQGNDTVFGGDGNDRVRGGKDNDRVFGDAGDDLLFGDLGTDTLTGGDGNDIFFLRKGIGGATITEADLIADFGNGSDLIGLAEGLKFDELNISQGSGDNARNTIIQDKISGQFLAVLQGVESSTIDRADFTTPAALAFSTATFSVNEDGTQAAAVTVNRTDSSEGAVSATVTPTDGTATAPADYSSTPIVVNFAPGDSTPKTVTIPTVDDALPEGTETLNLTLSSPTAGAIFGAQNTALLQILDNDSQSSPKLTFRNPNGKANTDYFGASVAAVGSNVLIGAQLNSPNGAGAAYLFDGTTGALVRTFRTPNRNQFDYSGAFGRSVAAVGSNVLIGDPLHTIADNPSAGAAYLFDGSTGALLQTFLDPTPGHVEQFGSSLAAVGNNVLIGAVSNNLNFYAGAAYLFDGTTGALLQTFLPPTPNYYDSFGRSLAAVGNNVLIGEPADDAAGENAGAVYLYDGTTGALLRTFLSPTPNAFDEFGNSLAVVGNNVFIGEPRDDAAGNNAGAVYLYDGTTGALLRTFLPPNPNEFGGFGFSVATVGNNVVIGALGDDTGGLDDGAVYLFDGNSGDLLQTFADPTPEELYSFGDSVAAVGNSILVGEPGAAYLFDAIAPVPVVP